MTEQFTLSQTDGRPMYLQIIELIKLRIAVDDWPSGHKLPSIRELAVAAKVSVITVKRAYQELENEGVIVTQQGRGSFVAASENIGAQLLEQELDEHLGRAIGRARSIGLSLDELIERIRRLYRKSEGTDDE